MINQLINHNHNHNHDSKGNADRWEISYHIIQSKLRAIANLEFQVSLAATSENVGVGLRLGVGPLPNIYIFGFFFIMRKYLKQIFFGSRKRFNIIRNILINHTNQEKYFGMR